MGLARMIVMTLRNALLDVRPETLTEEQKAALERTRMVVAGMAIAMVADTQPGLLEKEVYERGDLLEALIRVALEELEKEAALDSALEWAQRTLSAEKIFEMFVTSGQTDRTMTHAEKRDSAMTVIAEELGKKMTEKL